MKYILMINLHLNLLLIPGRTRGYQRNDNLCTQGPGARRHWVSESTPLLIRITSLCIPILPYWKVLAV